MHILNEFIIIINILAIIDIKHSITFCNFHLAVIYYEKLYKLDLRTPFFKSIDIIYT